MPRLCDSPYPEAVSAAFVGAWGPIQEICEGLVTPEVSALGDRFAELIPTLMAQLSEPPWTLSHGDYRLDNLFFSDDPARPARRHRLAALRPLARAARPLVPAEPEHGARGARRRASARSSSATSAGSKRGGVHGYDVDTAWFDYRLATLFDFVYPVIAGGGLTLANERAVALVRVIFARFVAAFEHLDCAAIALESRAASTLRIETTG